MSQVQIKLIHFIETLDSITSVHKTTELQVSLSLTIKTIHTFDVIGYKKRLDKSDFAANHGDVRKAYGKRN